MLLCRGGVDSLSSLLINLRPESVSIPDFLSAAQEFTTFCANFHDLKSLVFMISSEIHADLRRAKGVKL